MTRARTVEALMARRLTEADEALDVVAPLPEDDIAPPFVAAVEEGPRAAPPRPKRRRSVQRSRELPARVRGLLPWGYR